MQPISTRTGAPSEQQQVDFLEHIADGEAKDVAARKVGSTASRFRALVRRDEDFRRRYVEALEAAGGEYGEDTDKIDALEKMSLVRRLFEEATVRALDPDAAGNGSANRLLMNLCTLLVPEFKPFLEARMHRHVHSGAVGIFALPQIDTDKWSIEQHEEFMALEERRNELLEIARPEGSPKLEANGRKAKALPRADDGYPGFVEGEAVELIGDE